jgi:hypothetical protein
MPSLKKKQQCRDHPFPRQTFDGVYFSMRTVLASLAFLAAAATAFTVVPIPSSFPTRTVHFSSEPEDGEGELDLDLEEMFTMFEAADKDEDFEKAIKKVKRDE